ncbi:hypothetical protein JG687_00014081, partial [Phytophthora cactorum]
ERQGEALHRCKFCSADRKKLTDTGYSNLVSHLSSSHEDFSVQYDAPPPRFLRLFPRKPTIASSGFGGW